MNDLSKVTAHGPQLPFLRPQFCDCRSHKKFRFQDSKSCLLEVYTKFQNAPWELFFICATPSLGLMHSTGQN